MNPLAQSIEALLFATAEPQSLSVLAERLEVPKEDVAEAITQMQGAFSDHAFMLLIHGDVVSLVTKPEHSALLEAIRKEELSKELSKASAETLAIVCYIPGVSKAQVEFIRGVNASYSLRSLLMRGLIETKGTGRALLYHPTLSVLEHFGVSSLEGLPAYAQTKARLESLLQTEDEYHA